VYSGGDAALRQITLTTCYYLIRPHRSTGLRRSEQRVPVTLRLTSKRSIVKYRDSRVQRRRCGLTSNHSDHLLLSLGRIALWVYVAASRAYGRCTCDVQVDFEAAHCKV